MTKTDVIDYIDSIKPNVYTSEQKSGWIDLLEEKIRAEILSHFEKPKNLFAAEKKEKVTVLDDDTLYALLDENTLSLNGPVPADIKEIVEVPAKVTNMTVTAVQSEAFLDCTGITGIIIPESVTEITGNDFPAGIKIYGFSGSAAETYADEHNIPFVVYGLLASGPYEDMYYRWVEAQIDYANNETARYNNAMALFNDAFLKYRNLINRTYKHKTASLSVL